MESLGHSLGTGEITIMTGLIWLVLAGIVGALGGAASAFKLGAKDIGNEMALMMGSVFGPLAAVPGILIGLIILKFI